MSLPTRSALLLLVLEFVLVTTIVGLSAFGAGAETVGSVPLPTDCSILNFASAACGTATVF